MQIAINIHEQSAFTVSINITGEYTQLFFESAIAILELEEALP
jgi:regulation of enolase protein 1 (concanavalin A-like superfamily)